MGTLVFEDWGVPLVHGKITPGNTVTAFQSSWYNYVQYKCDFHDADTQFYVGDWILGGSSGAIAKVTKIDADTTTWTNNTGTFCFDSWNGTAFQLNEEITIIAAANIFEIGVHAGGGLARLRDDDYLCKNVQAKACLVSVYAGTVLIDISGGKPDQSRLWGQPMAAGSSILLRSFQAMKNFYCIDYTSGNNGIVQATFFF